MNYQLLKQNFENHGFRTSYFKSKEEASSYLVSKINNDTVGFGGSISVKEMGIYEKLAKHNMVFWHWEKPGADTLLNARSANVYITSVNGVSETGELVNIDGTGNRVAMTIYGPKSLYFIVGINKIMPNLYEALHRAKNVAAPKNAMRLNCNTPCAINGGDRCYDCNSPQRICKATVILERPCNGLDAEIIFINEVLGY